MKNWIEKLQCNMDWNNDTCTATDALGQQRKIEKHSECSAWKVPSGTLTTGREWYTVEGCAREFDTIGSAVNAAFGRLRVIQLNGSANANFVVVQDGPEDIRVALVDRLGAAEFKFRDHTHNVLSCGEYEGFYRVLNTTLKEALS